MIHCVTAQQVPSAVICTSHDIKRSKRLRFIRRATELPLLNYRMRQAGLQGTCVVLLFPSSRRVEIFLETGNKKPLFPVFLSFGVIYEEGISSSQIASTSLFSINGDGNGDWETEKRLGDDAVVAFFKGAFSISAS